MSNILEELNTYNVSLLDDCCLNIHTIQQQRIDELVDEGGKLLYKYNGLKIQLSKKDKRIEELEEKLQKHYDYIKELEKEHKEDIEHRLYIKQQHSHVTQQLSKKDSEIELSQNKIEELQDSLKDSSHIVRGEIFRLITKNKKLTECKNILKDFLTTKEDKQTWTEEMHGTIEEVLKGLEDK